jgi:hypothetical protein
MGLVQCWLTGGTGAFCSPILPLLVLLLQSASHLGPKIQDHFYVCVEVFNRNIEIIAKEGLKSLRSLRKID